MQKRAGAVRGARFPLPAGTLPGSTRRGISIDAPASVQPSSGKRAATAGINAMLSSTTIQCPYCGESIEILVDDSAGTQSYIEDCQVCCRPITIAVTVDDDGQWQVRASAQDEA
jgi:hypothetical protein